VIGLELRQCGDDRLGPVAHLAIAADQVRIDVGEARAAAGQAARPVQIEEDGAAADERLDVGGEARGIPRPQRGEELPLAAGPFEQRSHALIIGRYRLIEYSSGTEGRRVAAPAARLSRDRAIQPPSDLV